MNNPTPRPGVTVADIMEYCRKQQIQYEHEFNHGFNAGLEAVHVFITGVLANTNLEIPQEDREALDTLDDCLIPPLEPLQEAVDKAGMGRLFDDLMAKNFTPPIGRAVEEVIQGFMLERKNLNNRKSKI